MQYKTLLVSFDIDGTLLNDNHEVSETDKTTLINLDKPNIIRVAATGRNNYSVQKVLASDFPIDYVVFSSGAGILDWKTKKVIFSQHIARIDVLKVMELIEPYKLNFTVHLPIPNNHNILLCNKHADSEDLENYTTFYKEFVNPFNANKIPDVVTQIIVLLNSHVHLFQIFRKALLPLKTILTTSPVNHSSMWMEVFHSDVSKSNGIEWLIKYLKLDKPHTFAIGNDYNDIDMLEYADSSFVVANAPKILRHRFKVSKSNNEHGFTEALKFVL